jgi:putative transposase
MLVSYRYKLRPTAAQYARLAELCEAQRLFYNAALQERIDSYRQARRMAAHAGRELPIQGDFHTPRGKALSYQDQCKSLTEIRCADPSGFGAMPANIGRWTLKRVDDAFTGFFSRIKRGQKAGFPRFRPMSRWKSFGFAEFAGVRLVDDRLIFKGLTGGLRINMHRPIPDGAAIKTATLSKIGRHWHISLVLEIEPTSWHPAHGSAVGVDVGIEALATLSTGERIDNARPRAQHERDLRRSQRALARCQRGSRRRQKVRERVARVHKRIRNARTTYLHQQSAALTARFETIIVEDLRLKNLSRSARGTLAEPGKNVAAKSGLNRALLDAAPGRFITMLRYKVERTGGELQLVDAHGTSQICSGCGEKVPKPLRQRRHQCACGLDLHRDHNAARNILARAVRGPGCANVIRQTAPCAELHVGNDEDVHCTGTAPAALGCAA